LTCTTHDHGTATVVRVDGEIDLLTASDFGAELAHAIAMANSTVVIDLSEVEFMDSAAVHMLLNARALAGRVGVRLVLHKPTPEAAQVLEICGL
jgi:anti-sigma B factor antagonist